MIVQGVWLPIESSTGVCAGSMPWPLFFPLTYLFNLAKAVGTLPLGSHLHGNY